MTYAPAPTPCPWFKVWNGNYWEIQTDKVVHSSNGVNVSVFDLEPNSEANAKHIVHCVNLHDELLEALEGIITDGIFPKTVYDCKEVARKALSKAKGEQS